MLAIFDGSVERLPSPIPIILVAGLKPSRYLPKKIFADGPLPESPVAHDLKNLWAPLSILPVLLPPLHSLSKHSSHLTSPPDCKFTLSIGRIAADYCQPVQLTDFGLLDSK